MYSEFYFFQYKHVHQGCFIFAFQNKNLSAHIFKRKIWIASAKSKMFIWEILIE